jgi:hypothetical protein
MAATARICAKKAYFRLPLGDAPPRLPRGGFDLLEFFLSATLLLG